MMRKIFVPVVVGFLAVLLFSMASSSTALADQINLSYVDASGDPQTLSVDANSPALDLALVAALMGEDGVAVSHDQTSGSGTLAAIGAAMAALAPTFAPSIAQVLTGLAPEDIDAIVAAINAVPGINTEAVLAAVHFGPPGASAGPQSVNSGPIGVDFGDNIEVNPSRN